MSSKDNLYYILKQYILNIYDAKTFSEMFTDEFNLNIDSSLNSNEITLFKELVKIASRFSEFEEDLKLENVYYSENQVRQKAVEVYEQLRHRTI